MGDTYTLIVELRQVPEGCKITKTRGSKQYLVRDKIHIFDMEGANNTVIDAAPGVRFLIDTELGNATAAASDMPVAMPMTLEELESFVWEIKAEREDK